jgi:hypothetical protein
MFGHELGCGNACPLYGINGLVGQGFYGLRIGVNKHKPRGTAKGTVCWGRQGVSCCGDAKFHDAASLLKGINFVLMHIISSAEIPVKPFAQQKKNVSLKIFVSASLRRLGQESRNACVQVSLEGRTIIFFCVLRIERNSAVLDLSF